jgi:hypothetical protein
VSGDKLVLDWGESEIEFFCPEVGLQPGIYYTDVIVAQRGAPDYIDCQYQLTVLRIDPGKIVCGKFYLPHMWQLKQQTPTTVNGNEQATHLLNEVSSLI